MASNDSLKSFLQSLDPVKKKNKKEEKNYTEILQRVLQPKNENIVETKTGRRFIILSTQQGLENNKTQEFIEKISKKIKTAGFYTHSYSYWIENIEDGRMTIYYKNEKQNNSSRLSEMKNVEKWLEAKETNRLSLEKIHRPDTKWSFRGFNDVFVKIVFARGPLLGTGPLPNWLRALARGRNGPMVCLDTFGDNLCLWRCIAVFQGARPDRCEMRAKRLAKGFLLDATAKISLSDLDNVENYLNTGKPLKEWVGFRVYEPVKEDEQIHWIFSRALPEKITKIITIGFYNEHAFLINNIDALAKNFLCGNCNASFTRSSDLKRHNIICKKGETLVHCPASKVTKPTTAFERAFFPKNTASFSSMKWIENESKRLGIHIHHAGCGHGGERWVAGGFVDGFQYETKTVFQYHGCWWHGCPSCYPEERNKIVFHKEKTLEDAYQATLKRTNFLKEKGFEVKEIWECQDSVRKKFFIKTFTKTFPHAIFYDFEAYGDIKHKKELTEMLTFENVHVPVSVSIGDTFEKEPTHICDKNPAALIIKFFEELRRRARKIRELVFREFFPKDFAFVTKKQKNLMAEWCSQIPVVGFNCGNYDLNLIRNYFVDKLAESTQKVKVAKKGKTIMFIISKEFKFLDIMNYLAPGTSYEKWVKAYGCSSKKSWLPYEWFDSSEKLDYPGLPYYPEWYSKLKKRFVLTIPEWRACRKLFKEKGMKKFSDWLRYYNNLDVMPGLEALQKMKAFYTEKGIDIFKDAVSIPGVSLQYLIRGSLERGAELYSPCKEAYEMLKGAVVGGPSIVFTRYHVADVTKIRDHQYEEPNFCKNIVGYDANALYLSTMLEEMPCGKEEVRRFSSQEAAENEAHLLTKNLKEKNPSHIRKWFGFAEVDIEIPKHLWKKFEEMPPFFFNKVISDELVPTKMREYLEKTKRTRGEGKKLVGALFAQKILFYAPLLRWYVDHGAEITAVYRTIDYKPKKIFPWFVKQVTEARRTGDVDKSKALLADVFKLLGNSAYGKLIEALERQTNVIYTKDEKVVERALRSAYFSDLDEIGEAYELESRKPRVTITRAFQVGIAVYQLAKLRILEFYYDFLDKYFDRKDFELIQMDTDSCYMAISAATLEEIVKPPLKLEFEAQKNQWLAWDKWSGRTPGLFKLECTGSQMIALCSKCYFVEEKNSKKKKFSTKGMSQTQNRITWRRFKAALEGKVDKAKNRGFRIHEGKMVTYEQEKLGLSAYYDKRWVLPDGIHTEPIEYHLSETAGSSVS